MADKSKSESESKSSAPTVLFMADANAEPQKAKVVGHEGGNLTGYENLTLDVGKEGTFERVAPELGGPDPDAPRWRLDS